MNVEKSSFLPLIKIGVGKNSFSENLKNQNQPNIEYKTYSAAFSTLNTFFLRRDMKI